MKNANFIAIDFETATKSSRMPCQIGVAVVKNGVITDTVSYLIKPPRNRYSEDLIRIHRITPSMTENAPDFPTVWNEIKELFSANFIVAHNAAFDMDVLEKALSYYNIPKPIFMGYACTYKLTGMSLKDSCNFCGIDIGQHHDALCDSLACAKIFLKYLDGVEVTTHRIIENDDDSHKGHQPLRGGWMLGKDLTGANPEHPLFDKKTVITGEFSKWDRYKLASLLKSKGADLKSGVSSRIDFVAAGHDAGPSKMQKVFELNANGCNIVILGEDEITQLLEI